jgi:hypothetical protein
MRKGKKTSQQNWRNESLYAPSKGSTDGEVIFVYVGLLALLCLEYRLQSTFLTLELQKLRNFTEFSGFGLV